MIKANTDIISFNEIPALSEAAERSVFLVRHSMRESLKNGNLEPGLTPEGHSYAIECGRKLAGWQNVSYGASPRRRTMETMRDLIKGAGLPEAEITPCPAIYDAAMYNSEEDFSSFLEHHDVSAILKLYYSTGNAPGMVDLNEFSAKLITFLTQPRPGVKNLLLTSHDIVIVALLQTLGVRQFVLDDWCGYVHGAFLTQHSDGKWQAYYAVPDKENRKKYSLFI